MLQKNVYMESAHKYRTQGQALGMGRKGAHSYRSPAVVGGLVKADFFTLSRTLTISRKPSRRQERADVAESVLDSAFKDPRVILVVPLLGCTTTGK